MFSWFICSVFVLVLTHENQAQRTITDAEIEGISRAIWAADRNRLSDVDVPYGFIGPKLFGKVNDGKLQVGTYNVFIKLFQYYQPIKGILDPCYDPRQQQEKCRNSQTAFLNVINNTGPIQTLYEELKNRKIFNGKKQEFLKELRRYWFTSYSTTPSDVLDSSGFEHTFLGEISRGAVTGFHNWVRAYKEEKANTWIIGQHSSSSSCRPNIEAFSFNWKVTGNWYIKSSGTMFMRTSPEVEIALYTLCFMTRQNSNDCPILLEGNRLKISTWAKAKVPAKTILTAFPSC